MTITFRPILNECVVVMHGNKVVGTIRRYRAHKACIVSVPGLLTASMAIGQGKSVFPTIAAAKKAILALDNGRDAE
jgi:ribosome-interacting GTPase 1